MLNEPIVKGPSSAPRQAWLPQDDGLFLKGGFRLAALCSAAFLFVRLRPGPSPVVRRLPRRRCLTVGAVSWWRATGIRGPATLTLISCLRSSLLIASIPVLLVWQKVLGRKSVDITKSQKDRTAPRASPKNSDRKIFLIHFTGCFFLLEAPRH